MVRQSHASKENTYIDHSHSSNASLLTCYSLGQGQDDMGQCSTTLCEATAIDGNQIPGQVPGGSWQAARDMCCTTDERHRHGSSIDTFDDCAIEVWTEPMKDPQDTKIEMAAKMYFAAASGNAARVQQLLEFGADVNFQDHALRTALHIAAAYSRLPVVQVLLASKASLSVEDSWGNTPLDDAIAGNHALVVIALQNMGAVPGQRKLSHASSTTAGDSRESQDSSEATVKEPTLELAESIHTGSELCAAAATGNIKLLMEMLAAGVSANTADYDGRTALHLASSRGQVEAAKVLISARANLECRDTYGRVPLDEAMRSRRRSRTEEIGKVLAAAGAIDHRSDPSGAVEDKERLEQQSVLNQWGVRSEEVKLGKIISSTEKNDVLVAEWRGTTVVAKTVKEFDMMQGPTPSQPRGLVRRISFRSLRREGMEEMLHEISVLSSMRHPDLVLFLGACFDAKPMFLLSEYMEGGDLETYFQVQADRLRKPFKPPIITVINWALSIARGLNFMHMHTTQVIHRELNPKNLMLDRHKDLKITDFGLSQLVMPAFRKSSQPSSDSRDIASRAGFSVYMAPEMLRGEDHTVGIDIFSMSMVIYFMCTGSSPFHGDWSPDDLVKAYVKGEEPRPVMKKSIATAPLRSLMEEGWQVSPVKRPSASQCSQSLAALAVVVMCLGPFRQSVQWSMRHHVKLRCL